VLKTQILYIFLLHSAEVGTKIIDLLISCVFFETFFLSEVSISIC